MPQKQTAKVVLVGDSGVGKSTILSSYSGERFNPLYVQTREREIKHANVQVGKLSIDLQIWDTPGTDNCRTVTAAYMRDHVQGVIIVFDVNSDESYFNVHHWVQTVKQFAGAENVKFVFVGNKNDVGEEERKVLHASGEQLAIQHNGTYIDASAKKKDNIDQIFKKMAESILNVESDMNTSTRESGVDEGGDSKRGGFPCNVL